MGMGGAAPGGGSSSVEWMCVHVCVCTHVLALWDKMWFILLLENEMYQRPLKRSISSTYVLCIMWPAWKTILLQFWHFQTYMRSQTGHIFGNYTISSAITTSTCEFCLILPLIIYMLLAQIPSRNWNVWLITFYHPPPNQPIRGEHVACWQGNQSPVPAAGWELEINAVLDAVAQLHRS